MLQCVSVCCSVLQGHEAVCCGVCCSVLQCVAVCCSVLQCVAVCCSHLIWVGELCIQVPQPAPVSIKMIFARNGLETVSVFHIHLHSS